MASDSQHEEVQREPCDECGNLTRATKQQLATGVKCAGCKTKVPGW